MDLGGNVIGMGGFGCVFKPAITCNNAKINENMRKNGYDYITKVLIKKNADSEMKEVEKILPLVKNITNFKKYFILHGIYKCDNFGPLNSEDLKNFKDDCLTFKRYGIDETNINSKLSELSTLYIPYGGDSLEKLMKDIGFYYFKHNTDRKYKNILGLTVLSMIDVLKNAIIPMNRLGLLHMDIKADNFLIDRDALGEGKMPYIKIIDWGLACFVPIDKKDVPFKSLERPLTYNLPFSAILLDKTFIDKILKQRAIHSRITENQLINIAVDIIYQSVDNWEGHEKYITSIMEVMLNPYRSGGNIKQILGSYKLSASTPLTYATQYIADILKKFLVVDGNGLYKAEFEYARYFHDVYIHNCDVWGLILSFSPLVRMTVGKQTNPIVKLISNIIFKYCYSSEYACKPINIDDFVSDMRLLSFECGIKTLPDHVTTPPSLSSTRSDSVYTPDHSIKTISLRGKKKCPKGYKKHPTKLGHCRKNVSKKVVKTSLVKPLSSYTITLKNKKNCPKGYKKHPTKKGYCKKRSI